MTSLWKGKQSERRGESGEAYLASPLKAVTSAIAGQ